jgi:photosystem II stability/assembly factor-like uncharacterized protein
MHSAQAQWQQVVLPDSGNIYTLQQYTNKTFIGTKNTNFFAVSTDGFITYTLLNPVTPNDSITDVYSIINDSIFVAFSGNQADPNFGEMYQSTDSGNTWTMTLDTTLSLFIEYISKQNNIVFAISASDSYCMSLDKGATWNFSYQIFNVLSSSYFYSGIITSDSILIIGGWNFSSLGNPGFFRSHNLGMSWVYTELQPITALVTNIKEWAQDTLYACGYVPSGGYNGYYIISDDNGLSWSINQITNGYRLNDIIFRDRANGFVVGGIDYLWYQPTPANADGMIGVTSDSGQTWTTYSTGIATLFQKIVLLEDDSTAIISGTNGVLLRWNTYSPITSAEPIQFGKPEMPMWLPVPSSGKILLNAPMSPGMSCSIYDLQGKKVFEIQNALPGKITLPTGLYFARFEQSGLLVHTQKLVIE